jgi:hypothetical protein
MMITPMMTLLGFLPLPHTTLYSDYTERGGETCVQMTEEADGLRLRGMLLGIIGRKGTRVGFVGLRRRLALSANERLFIRVSGVEDLRARAVFKTIHRRLPPYSGDLTFQTLLAATADAEVYEIRLEEVRPVIRGTEIRSPLPHPFRAEEVNEFAFELKLSEQDFDPETGLPFDVKVYFEGRPTPSS